ncbi:unnamed protein product [Orchesella dallaii]|uniref:Uncharacterized protein n=1 Tax=Orchesella dallaii TaxID=48710 RepID=A0ABP1RMP5_9HEXA
MYLYTLDSSGHYRSKRNSKRKINSDICSWLDEDQIDEHKEPLEKMNEIGLPMAPSPTTRDSLMDELVGQPALSEAQRPEAESVEWGHPCPTSGLRVGGWFC